MTTRDTPLYPGDNPPGNTFTWASAGTESASFGVSTAVNGEIIATLASAFGSTDTNTDWRRRWGLKALSNTVNPVIDMAFSVAALGQGAEFGVVITGTTGAVSCVISNVLISDYPAIMMYSHTDINDRGTSQPPTSVISLGNTGLIWMRLSFDTTASNRVDYSLSLDGVNWFVAKPQEFLSIGTLENYGPALLVNSQVGSRNIVTMRVYHLEDN